MILARIASLIWVYSGTVDERGSWIFKVVAQRNEDSALYSEPVR